MEKLQNIKEQLAADLKKIEDAVSYSSLSNLREDLAKVVADTKRNAEKHFSALEAVNEKADRAADPFLTRVVESCNTAPILILLAVALFAAGLLVGLKL